ncbi:MAG: alpha-ketoglutarate-dependent dioxygenase AlkB [Xanthomonadales bacterium]|nr:alpha-ketoglutarate-dependent dioxygenase AlkB [Xanthomonadales bacterium]
MASAATCAPGLPPGFELRADYLAPEAARATFSRLLEELSFEQPQVRIFGRRLPSPRLACWIGDEPYRYSGLTHPPRPWTPTLAELRDRLAAELRVPFNGVLLNLYRDGRDRMGWHADDEPELGPEPVIASLSLGAERDFALRRRPRGPILRFPLPSGSLLVMSGRSQRDFLHALPPAPATVGPRLNLSFRRLLRAPAARGRRAPAPA